GPFETPRVGDAAAGTHELLDRHGPPVVVTFDDPPSPLVEVPGACERTPEDDRPEAVRGLLWRRCAIRLRCEAAHLGEAELLASDQDAEVVRPVERFVLLETHARDATREQGCRTGIRRPGRR